MFGVMLLVIAAYQLVLAESISHDDVISPNNNYSPYGAELALNTKTGSEQQLIQRSTNSGCPLPFMYISSVKGCYFVVSDNLEWDIAAIRCRSMRSDAHLVVIDNAHEQSAVAGLLAWHTSMGLVNNVLYGHFWTAGQRVNPSRASTFVWRISPEVCSVNSVKEMRYTHWGSGEPNNGVNPVEDCALMVRGYSYGWADVTCSTPRGAVCEIDL